MFMFTALFCIIYCRIYAKPEGVESSEDDNEGEEDWYGTVWSDSEFSFG